jgi:ribA/ribD-fused uncharacterized protein
LEVLKDKYSKAQDEIIILKNTIAAQQDPGKFTTIPTTSEPHVIYFRGDQHPLSNLFHIKNGLKMFGHKFLNSEGTYQYCGAVHAKDSDAAGDILKAKNGWQAMDRGNLVKQDQLWHAQKEQVMFEILKEKSRCCEEYVKFLIDSKDATLVEDTQHKFWGKGTASVPGKNMLGRIHMQIRESLLNEPNPTNQMSHQYDHREQQSQKRKHTQQQSHNRNHTTWQSHTGDHTEQQSHTREHTDEQSHESVHIEQQSHKDGQLGDKHDHIEQQSHNQGQGQGCPDAKSVLIIGNSHTTGNFYLNRIDASLQVSKRAAMNIREAFNEVQKLDQKPDVLVIHEITNDVQHSEQNAFRNVRDMVELSKLAAKKANHAIISLGLPRSDDEIKHNLTQMINHEIVQALSRQKVNVTLCYNDNLSYRGQADFKYMARDGKHLSTAGKAVFSRNLVHAIHNTLGGRSNGFKDKW